MQPTAISEISDKPKYNIKAASKQTGIRPVTMRAWERRYALLTPYRSEYNRYRLYSDRDIAILRWVKSKVDEGVSISSVVSEVRSLLDSGNWPALAPALQPVSTRTAVHPPEYYAQQLYNALSRHDETTASDILRETQSLFDLTAICMEVIAPCLVEIGEAWHRGEMRITTEHLASAFLRGKLMGLLQAYPARRKAACVIVGCAPSELHEIGSIMLSTLLRRDGYRLEYLGPDVPLDDIIDYARFEHPAMIILSATLERNALELTTFQEKLSRLHPAPLFGYGGRIFNIKPALCERIPGIFLGPSLNDAVQKVHQLLR